jgi:hypothetical protein
MIYNMQSGLFINRKKERKKGTKIGGGTLGPNLRERVHFTLLLVDGKNY